LCARADWPGTHSSMRSTRRRDSARGSVASSASNSAASRASPSRSPLRAQRALELATRARAAEPAQLDRGVPPFVLRHQGNSPCRPRAPDVADDVVAPAITCHRQW
jgi:hypothetical protein